MTSILELKEVSKSYDEFKAVDRISMTIPDSGEVRTFGESFCREHLQRIGYLPEERGLYKRMKVGELLIFFARLKGVSLSDARKRSQYWLDRLDLTRWTASKVEELSKGMQQK